MHSWWTHAHVNTVLNMQYTILLFSNVPWPNCQHSCTACFSRSRPSWQSWCSPFVREVRRMRISRYSSDLLSIPIWSEVLERNANLLLADNYCLFPNCGLESVLLLPGTARRDYRVISPTLLQSRMPYSSSSSSSSKKKKKKTKEK